MKATFVIISILVASAMSRASFARGTIDRPEKSDVTAPVNNESFGPADSRTEALATNNGVECAACRALKSNPNIPLNFNRTATMELANGLFGKPPGSPTDAGTVH